MLNRIIGTLLLYITTIPLYSQQRLEASLNMQKQIHEIELVDSLRIYISPVRGTGGDTTCSFLNSLKGESMNNMFYISLKDSLRKSIFTIKKESLKPINNYKKGIYVNALIEQYTQGKSKRFCFSTWSGTNIFDSQDKAFEFDDSIVGLINILIYNKVIDGEFNCAGKNCYRIKPTDLTYFLVSGLKNIRNSTR